MLNPSSTTSAPSAPAYGLQTSRPTSLFLPPTSSVVVPSSNTGFTPQSFTTLLTPTSGTPLAMTPNTLKSIEQSILQTLGEDPEQSSYMMESQQYSGNFVPPLPSSTSTITLINTWQGGQVSSSDMDGKDEVVKNNNEPEQQIKPVEQDSNNKKRKAPPQKKKPVQKATPAPKRNAQQKPAQQKGQKPAKSAERSEEDDRRKIRRERNKLAAARCRKRRVDHTNKLIEETEGLEAKKRSLQNQITELQSQKEELEFILEAHTCVKKIKSEVQVLSDLQNLPSTRPEAKLKRPNTLNVIGGGGGEQRTPINVSTPAPPIPINTPSNGIAGLGFEPLCSDWGVNTPTPIGEGGSSVVGGGGGDEKMNVPESRDLKSSLVTPVNPYKKLHDL